MIDPKAAAGTIGAALATLLWTLLATFVSAVSDMPAETLATVTGASAVVFTAVLAYLTPNLASKLLARASATVAGAPTGTNVEASGFMPDGPSEAHEGATAAGSSSTVEAPAGVPTE